MTFVGKLSIFLFMSLSGFSSLGQWVGVADFDREIRALYSDSSHGQLIIGGGFTRVDGYPTSGIAAYDGLAMDTDFVDAGGIVTAITSFNDTIFIGGYFQTSNAGGQTVWTGGFAKRCGNSWCPGYGIGTNGVVRDFEILNGELWAAGGFDSINGSYSPYLFALNQNGVRLVGVPSSEFRGGLMTGIEPYDNQLYCVGTFMDSIGVIYNFASVDANGTWSQTCQPNWCHPLLSIGKYGNQLVVSGSTITSPSQCVFGYDGATPQALSMGINGAAIQLKELNGYLFAVGYFDHADGLPASHVAIWNGVSWSAFSPSVIDNAVAAIEVFNGELYIGGGFRIIDGDSITSLAKFDGNWSAVADSIINTALDVRVYPNPSHNIFTLALPLSAEEVEAGIIDATGRCVWQGKVRSNEPFSLDLSDGIYSIVVRFRNGYKSEKLVVMR